MTSKTFPLSRRRLLELTGVAIGTQMLTACTGGAFSTPQSVIAPSKTPPSFSLFYKPEHTGNIWDTWIYYHNGVFHLYYNPRPKKGELWEGVALWNGIAMATSSDGVHWQEHGFIIDPVPNVFFLGAGAVWPAGDKFIMNFSEWPLNPDGSRGQQTIHFAESDDLRHWRRLRPDYAFTIDKNQYDPKGRWDNIWPLPRPEGGYYGYFAAKPKDREVGVGFAESDDGIHWKALPPPVLNEVLPLPIAEVAGVHRWKDKYYILHTSWDQGSMINVLVGDSPSGPFSPTPKSRRFLVGNGSYFPRFVDTPDGVLVNHHSWEYVPGERGGVDPGRVYLAPLKRAHWDDEGTLRMKWWEGNDKAKAKSVPLKSNLIETNFDPEETLILEGVIPLSTSSSGLYLQGADDRGTGFLVYATGLVMYGDINPDGSGFELKGLVNRELSFGDTARFRLVRKGRMTEFYLNDYLMQLYSPPELGSGRIGVIGPADKFRSLKAWYCA